MRDSFIADGNPRFGGIAMPIDNGGNVPGGKTGGGPDFAPGRDTNRSWQEGARFDYTVKLPVIHGRDQGIDLTTETYLGRERSYKECLEFMARTFGRPLVIDNGC